MSDDQWRGAVVAKETWHFHRRLLERYGIVLGPADYSRIVNAIREHHLPIIECRPDGSNVYLVQVPSTGSWIFVAAKPSGRLITALSANERLLSLVEFTREDRQRSNK